MRGCSPPACGATPSTCCTKAVPDASVGAERSERVLAALPAALAAAWAMATEYGGADPGRWRWGDVHQAARVHPLSEVGPLPGVPMGGDADTIQAAGYGWKLNMDLSGHRLSDFPHSAHYDGPLAEVEFRPNPNLWVLEIAIAHPERKFGAFYEDLLLEDQSFPD